jgi:hypothetical protein
VGAGHPGRDAQAVQVPRDVRLRLAIVGRARDVLRPPSLTAIVDPPAIVGGSGGTGDRK